MFRSSTIERSAFQLRLMKPDAVCSSSHGVLPASATPLSWWQRVVQPSVLRRLVLAQMVLLLQLWGALLLWRGSAATPLQPSSGTWLDSGLVIVPMVPIVVSGMLLVIPAWLAMRVALRPWRQLNGEIAARGPHDLAPISFEPRQQELRPVVQSVNALLGRVRQSVQRERSFIADAAHELRTPLAALRVNVDALQDRLTDARSAEQLAAMVQSCDRAARLVGQLLQLMRTDAVDSAAAPQALALDRLVEERLATLSALARPRGIELQLDAAGPVEVWGDPESLASMIDNLVENAIKYSPPHGTVIVGIASRDGHAVLSVADQGPGIAPDLRLRVFDRFYRGPGQTQAGSGLGLAIVKAAVERHHGTVSLATGTAGQGLRVVLALPLAVSDRTSDYLSQRSQPSTP
jgi:signal transduction histidine kinase